MSQSDQTINKFTPFVLITAHIFCFRRHIYGQIAYCNEVIGVILLTKRHFLIQFYSSFELF